MNQTAAFLPPVVTPTVAVEKWMLVMKVKGLLTVICATSKLVHNQGRRVVCCLFVCMLLTPCGGCYACDVLQEGGHGPP
jgi:hypothetical protein